MLGEKQLEHQGSDENVSGSRKDQSADGRRFVAEKKKQRTRVVGVEVPTEQPNAAHNTGVNY